MVLLCTDYKVLSRSLSNRLKNILEIIVHPDQTYCIPNSTITDNIFLMHDVIDGCKGDNVRVGIVSLDQEKEFHRVDHSYLFSALK